MAALGVSDQMRPAKSNTTEGAADTNPRMIKTASIPAETATKSAKQLDDISDN
jgi:hypothetical protein